jgi:thiosulfate/3-mercaptopyruvate sulfurtransferase
LGSALNGSGEEGRLAWTLLYLGVKNVEVAQVDSLGLYYSNMEVPPKENVPYWQPQLSGGIWAERDEVKDAVNLRHNERVHILDVRSKNEYFSKNKALEYEFPDLRAINIQWSEFYKADGRPSQAIKQQLRAINVQPTDRILVICDNGLRSGAVTYALLALGYKKAASVAGGYPELLKLPQNRK